MSQNKKEKFAHIYEENISSIYRYVYARVLNKENAEDITSKTFTIAYEKFDESKIKRETSIKSWLFTIARNVLGNEYQKIKPIQVDEIEDNSIFDDDISIEEEYISKDDVEQIRKKFEQLDLDSREILLLRLWEDMKFKDIAVMMESKLSAVKMKYYRALEKVREDLRGSKRFGFVLLCLGKAKDYQKYIPEKAYIKTTFNKLLGKKVFHLFGKTIEARKMIIAGVSGVIVVVIAGGGYIAKQEYDEWKDSKRTEEEVFDEEVQEEEEDGVVTKEDDTPVANIYSTRFYHYRTECIWNEKWDECLDKKLIRRNYETQEDEVLFESINSQIGLDAENGEGVNFIVNYLDMDFLVFEGGELIAAPWPALGKLYKYDIISEGFSQMAINEIYSGSLQIDSSWDWQTAYISPIDYNIYEESEKYDEDPLHYWQESGNDGFDYYRVDLSDDTYTGKLVSAPEGKDDFKLYFKNILYNDGSSDMEIWRKDGKTFEINKVIESVNDSFPITKQGWMKELSRSSSGNIILFELIRDDSENLLITFNTDSSLFQLVDTKGLYVDFEDSINNYNPSFMDGDRIILFSKTWDEMYALNINDNRKNLVVQLDNTETFNKFSSYSRGEERVHPYIEIGSNNELIYRVYDRQKRDSLYRELDESERWRIQRENLLLEVNKVVIE